MKDWTITESRTMHNSYNIKGGVGDPVGYYMRVSTVRNIQIDIWGHGEGKEETERIANMIVRIPSLTNGKWISSKDHKPEYNVSVLVFIPAEDNHCTVGMWDISNKWVLLDEYRVPKSEVTYWREMVELPEDKSYDPNHPSEQSDEMDTTTEIIRNLQKKVYHLEKWNKKMSDELKRLEV